VIDSQKYVLSFTKDSILVVYISFLEKNHEQGIPFEAERILCLLKTIEIIYN